MLGQFTQGDVEQALKGALNYTELIYEDVGVTESEAAHTYIQLEERVNSIEEEMDGTIPPHTNRIEEALEYVAEGYSPSEAANEVDIDEQMDASDNIRAGNLAYTFEESHIPF